MNISPSSSAKITSDFRIFKKSAAAYAAAKGYKYWPGVIELLEPMSDKEWKTKHPDKSQYVAKRTTKVSSESKPDILKQEWIVIDCEKQEELEDNYNNKLRQKLAKHALYQKNDVGLFIVLYGQLHSNIVTIAKYSIIHLFATVHKESDVVGLLSILRLICVQNLTGSKVDLYLEQLKILSSTLSYAQSKCISNHDFGDAVHD